MSRIKVSFSLLFAIFLVGILSTAAFAHSAYTWSVNPDLTSTDTNYAGFNVSATPLNGETGFYVQTFTKDASTGTVTATGKTYQVTTPVKDKNGNITSYTGVIPPADVKVGQEYQVTLFDSNNNLLQDKLVVISAKELAMANVNNPKANSSTDPLTVITNSVTVDANGSGLANSNHTGADKKSSTYAKGTHGFYMNNTNTCASCHQTHTSDDASGNLLMKNGSYSTCTSCHDGTTGGYNAFQPADASVATTIAGTFNVTMDGMSGTHNGSIHDADGSLQVSAAPGGGGVAGSSQYTSSFDCASCHNPHGGSDQYSSENNLNQDPLGWGAVTYNASTKDGQNGRLFVAPILYTTDGANGTTKIPTTNVAPYIFVLKAAGVDMSTLSTTSTEYFYLHRDGYVSGQPLLETYRYQKGGYTPDFTAAWMQDKGYPGKADTVLKDSTGKDITRDSDVNAVWYNGFAYGAGVANVVSSGSKISLGVNVEVTPYIQTLYQAGFSTQDSKGNTWSYIPDSGVAMSKYCAACHTDYLSTTRTVNTGVYTTAHRHMTLADETNCIRCHYAHGTDASIMHDANDNTMATPNNGTTQTHSGDLSYYKDPNFSSALKRYTGMSACYACHGNGEQFLSNPNNIERPLFGQPGATRSTDPNAVN